MCIVVYDLVFVTDPTDKGCFILVSSRPRNMRKLMASKTEEESGIGDDYADDSKEYLVQHRIRAYRYGVRVEECASF